MTTSGKLPRRSRWAGLGLVGALLLALSGDGIGASPLEGIDPLDVLNLQVKPNVFIVLDTSGSMQETLYQNALGGAVNFNTGDWRESKLGLGKTVLTSFVQQNVSKASFLFGQYTLAGSRMQRTGLADGNGRFRYLTYVNWQDANNNNVFNAGDTVLGGLTPTMRTACAAPWTTPCELTLAGRGFQAWQDIKAGWNTFYYSENGQAAPGFCTVTIPVGFYQSGATLATAIQTGMNGCSAASRPAPTQTYAVAFNAANGKFTFSVTGTYRRSWTLQWTRIPNNIAGALSAYSGTTGSPSQPTYANQTCSASGCTLTTSQNSLQLLWRDPTYQAEEVNFDPDGTGPLPTLDRTTYYWRANRYFNGELFYVHGNGSLCGATLTSPVKTNPPSIRFQQVSNCANLTTTVGPVVTMEYGGGLYGGNNISCQGFSPKVKLQKCDQNPPGNTTLITSQLDKQFPIDGVAASPTFGALKGYVERQDGTWAIATVPQAGGVLADGSTPIANSLIDIRPVFSSLWFSGQADDPATPTVNELRIPLRSQPSPREKTIVMFVTDGDDTCDTRTSSGGNNDDNAKRAAHKAQQLYAQLEAGFPESSVSTYLIGFGTGASVNRLNWIAWGGSGMGQGLAGQPAVATTGAGEPQRWNETAAQLTAKRALCTTCVDAFIAPDAATLATQLQSILDQGASTGEFTAQQGVFVAIPELVKELNTAGAPFDPEAPNTRYNAIVPNLFRSSFIIPGFKGQFKAFQNTGGQVSLKWNAGQKLYDRVSTAFACAEGGTALATECRFSSLTTRIDRRIYTTSRNGVFGAAVADLTNDAWLSGTLLGDGNRTALWPPRTLAPSAAPPNDVTPGIFDAALGLPTADVAATTTQLQASFKTCLGAPLPAACTGGTVATQAQRNRREAREMILAFMAGGQVVIDVTNLPKRITIGPQIGEVLYMTRDWILADSTLAVPAVIPSPIESEPTNSGFVAEYKLFRDGFRDANNDATGNGTRIGFGLTNPDRDGSHTSTAPASDIPNLKPAMTVAYVGANDMLHAFRAGPNCGTPGTFEAPPGLTRPPFSGFLYETCAEKGGEELWGFVPFDQLGKLSQRMSVQTRASHAYMIAAAIRVADVFVPNPGTTSNPSGATTNITLGSKTETVKGVWRRVLVFGRGIGGKYLTALDVTTAGNYKTLASASVPPVPLWSRGNIDSVDGTAAGTDNNTVADRTAYAKMGETWSTPVITLADRAFNRTTRKAAGVDFVVYVGSGYGTVATEGKTFFTLDALTGDVIAAADLPASSGIPAGGYQNAIVADAVAFVGSDFVLAATGQSSHPAANKPSRVYFGDLHGRLWKILTDAPGTPLLVTDLGLQQPIAAAVSVLGFDESGVIVPYVYVTSGFDNRQDPAVSGVPFVIAGIKDDQTGALSPSNACQSNPVVAPCLFRRDLTQAFQGVTGFFRGTVQPAVLLSNSNPPVGRVFFAGTRFNLPRPLGAPFAPPAEPCKSSFDSIVFALGAKTGDAAFDLNANPTADDSFVIFDNSKIAGLSIVAAPDPAGGTATKLLIDEGLATGGGGGAGTPDIPPGGPAPGTLGTGAVTTQVSRTSSTVCQ